jgi:hypothetical protein
VRAQSFDDGRTALPLHSGWPKRQPILRLGHMRQTIRLPNTRDTVGPPGLPAPRPVAHTVQGGRQGPGAAALRERSAKGTARGGRRTALLARRMACPTSLALPPRASGDGRGARVARRW